VIPVFEAVAFVPTIEQPAQFADSFRLMNGAECF